MANAIPPETRGPWVKCDDCKFAAKIKVKNSMGDGYCEIADKTLVGIVRSRRAMMQPRRCAKFEPT